jgi:hypothetical protein
LGSRIVFISPHSACKPPDDLSPAQGSPA